MITLLQETFQANSQFHFPAIEQSFLSRYSPHLKNFPQTISSLSLKFRSWFNYSNIKDLNALLTMPTAWFVTLADYLDDDDILTLVTLNKTFHQMCEKVLLPQAIGRRQNLAWIEKISALQKLNGKIECFKWINHHKRSRDEISQTIDCLRHNPHIQFLQLKGWNFKNADISQIFSALPNLQELDLSYCSGVTNQNLMDLKNHSKLRHLHLAYCSNIKDYSLSIFRGMKHLHSLNLIGCELTDRALKDFKKSSPHIRIDHDLFTFSPLKDLTLRENQLAYLSDLQKVFKEMKYCVQSPPSFQSGWIYDLADKVIEQCMSTCLIRDFPLPVFKELAEAKLTIRDVRFSFILAIFFHFFLLEGIPYMQDIPPPRQRFCEEWTATLQGRSTVLNLLEQFNYFYGFPVFCILLLIPLNRMHYTVQEPDGVKIYLKNRLANSIANMLDSKRTEFNLEKDRKIFDLIFKESKIYWDKHFAIRK